MARAVSLSLALVAALIVPALAIQPRTLTDVKGRTVTLPKDVKRLLIDDGRYLVALSLIHPNPASVLAGWPREYDESKIFPVEQATPR